MSGARPIESSSSSSAAGSVASARHGEHLLLAARHGAGDLLAALLEAAGELAERHLWVVTAIPCIGVIVWIVSFVLLLTDPQYRTVGVRAANTFVVKTK